MNWNDPRLARRLQRLLDRRDDQTEIEPVLLRGTVLANDNANLRSTVRFARAAGFDDVPVPWASFKPAVNQEVLMRYEPDTGDAYLEKGLI